MVTYRDYSCNRLGGGGRMKIRLAKKIMKANLEVYPFYWHRRWTPYHLYVCTVNKPWGAKKDHRITKAISLTRKKKWR